MRRMIALAMITFWLAGVGAVAFADDATEPEEILSRSELDRAIRNLKEELEGKITALQDQVIDLQQKVASLTAENDGASPAGYESGVAWKPINEMWSYRKPSLSKRTDSSYYFYAEFKRNGPDTEGAMFTVTVYGASGNIITTASSTLQDVAQGDTRTVKFILSRVTETPRSYTLQVDLEL